jgi:hypothetical protein
MCEVLRKINNKLSDLDLSVWDRELKGDIDREYILDGIQHGFKIVDDEVVKTPVDIPNHVSCTKDDNKYKVEQVLRSEILNGRYVPVKKKPDICNPMAAIEKSDGTVQVLHDASRPMNLALNDYATDKVNIKYQGVKDAIDFIVPHS